MGTAPDDEFTEIPILLEPVAEAPAPAAPAEPDQGSLFGEAPPATGRPRTARRSPVQVRREAVSALAARIPAIVDDLVAAEAERLAALLRARLAAELAQILKDAADGD